MDVEGKKTQAENSWYKDQIQGRSLLSLFQEQPRGQKGWSRMNERNGGEGWGREEVAEVGTGCVGPKFYSKWNGEPVQDPGQRSGILWLTFWVYTPYLGNELYFSKLKNGLS